LNKTLLFKSGAQETFSMFKIVVQHNIFVETSSMNSTYLK